MNQQAEMDFSEPDDSTQSGWDSFAMANLEHTARMLLLALGRGPVIGSIVKITQGKDTGAIGRIKQISNGVAKIRVMQPPAGQSRFGYIIEAPINHVEATLL